MHIFSYFLAPSLSFPSDMDVGTWQQVLYYPSSTDEILPIKVSELWERKLGSKRFSISPLLLALLFIMLTGSMPC
jgi:hypothetical protein